MTVYIQVIIYEAQRGFALRVVIHLLCSCLWSLHEPQGWEQCSNLSFALQWLCGWFKVMVLVTAPPGHQQASLLMKDLCFNILGDVLITNSLSNI